MKVPKLSSRRVQLHRWLRFSPVALAFVGSAVTVLLLWPRPGASLADDSAYPKDLRVEYAAVVQKVNALERRQQQQGTRVVAKAELTKQLSLVQLDANSGHFGAAKSDIAALRQAVANWNLELSGGTAAGRVSSGPSTTLPILLYHYPPANFEAQLVHLEQAGYTTIDLDEAEAGLHGGPLPPKPVVITFDDGFAAQWGAYETLVRHNMKATFYIIAAGEASRWCIGAGRRYGDPLQPGGGCGDNYLSWNQVREIDHSGLITIGGHTVNHRNLATLGESEQRFEIQTGKQLLETQLGHAVRHFAYPYGAYDAWSIEIAREAGYTTAVTVTPGMQQPPGSDFTLRRERDALLLP